MYKILGFSPFKSKAGKDLCTIQLAREFSDYEKANGAIGMRAVKKANGDDYFLPPSQFDIISDKNIGLDCDIWFNDNNFIAQVVIK